MVEKRKLEGREAAVEEVKGIEERKDERELRSIRPRLVASF
jgi:hypothetical protein